MTKTSSTKALFIICSWALFCLLSSNTHAQTRQVGDQKLEQLLLNEALESPTYLIKNQLLIDWKKYPVKELLQQSWLSAKNLAPVNLGLSGETITYLTKQFEAQQSGEWEASFLSKINQKGKTAHRYAMSVPVFSQDRKMVFIAYGHEDGEVLMLLRKQEGEWKRYAMLQLWGA